jgi:hypothetical protein
MNVRMFGLFGAILASGYLIQGLSYIRPTLLALARRPDETFVWRFTIMSLDFSFGLSLLIAAIGLFFVKEWARNMWLIVTSLLVAVHLVMIVLGELGRGNSTFYLIWTWMVLMATVMSWWYLNKSSITSRFRPKEPEIEVEGASPADAST